MLFSANHSVGTYHVVIFVVEVANMRWNICNPSWHFNILWTDLMILHSRNLQHGWRKCNCEQGFKELLVNKIANWWSDICHLAFSTLVHCGGAAREEDGRQEGEERCGRDHFKLFRHSKPERGGNILDQGFISLDAQDSIGSTSQNWWPTKPTPHVSRLLPPHSQVTHWSMLATKVLSRNHTRLGQPTSPSRRWKSLKRRGQQAGRQAGRKSVAAGRKSGTAGWDVPVATETDAGRLLAHRWAIPLANTKVVQEQIQGDAYIHKYSAMFTSQPCTDSQRLVYKYSFSKLSCLLAQRLL